MGLPPTHLPFDGNRRFSEPGVRVTAGQLCPIRPTRGAGVPARAS